MKKVGIKLYDLVNLTRPQDVLDELDHIVSLVVSDFDHAFLKEIFLDIKLVFSGDYPGYQASNTKYHDFEHTCAVTLAAARLIHGAFVGKKSFTAKNILLGLCGALFHDIGFIQTEDDMEGSGAKYTIGHEQRSVEFMTNHLLGKSMGAEEIEACAQIIMCTILGLSIKDITFNSNDFKLLGQIVGSADLLAQMADREYLEKLFMLFREFEEAGLPGYGSELDLLRKTEDFYKYVALQRLSEDFDGIATFMNFHFKERWGLDRDMYQESILANIEYLRTVVHKCNKTYSCYLDFLRRGGLAEKLRKL